VSKHTPSEHWRIELFDKGVDTKAFTCGVLALDRYLQQQASQDSRRGFATVFLALDGESRILGYYSLSMAGVSIELLPDELRSKMPRYPSVPSVRLGRLAVSTETRGCGMGKYLLMDAMHRSLQSKIAWACFIVEAKDDNAKAFYQQYGFMRFMDDPNHLFLPRATVNTAFAESSAT
jgi:GNAT superfamily N-acetyltransferase